MNNFYYYRGLGIINDGMHVLIHGEPKSGKKTVATRMVQAMLPYDITKCVYTHEYFRIVTSHNKISELNTWLRRGKFHVEIDLFNLMHSYDVYIISHVLKSLEYGSIGQNGQLQRTYVLLFHFEKASKETQYLLRRVLEKRRYTTFIITARSTGNLCESMTSRFHHLRIPSYIIHNDIAFWKERLNIINGTMSHRLVEYRRIFYELILIGIEAKDIMKHMYTILKQSQLFDPHALVDICASNEHRMVNSLKPIYFLENMIYETFSLLE